MQSFHYIYEFLQKFSKKHFLEIAAISKTFGKPIKKKAVLFEFETFFLFQIAVIMTVHQSHSSSETMKTLFCDLIKAVEAKYQETVSTDCRAGEVILSRIEQYQELLTESDKVLPDSVIKRFSLNVNGAANGKIKTNYPIIIDKMLGDCAGSSIITNVLLENPNLDYLLFQSCLKSLFQSKKEISELTQIEVNNLLAGGYDIFCAAIENKDIVPQTNTKFSNGNIFSTALFLVVLIYFAF